MKLGKEVGSQLCEAPGGPFRQLTPAPFTIDLYHNRKPRTHK